MALMEQLVELVLLFFVYSLLGWCTEVTLKFIQYHRFINRGFLTGPVCPIYGSGALLITLGVRWIAKGEPTVSGTFLIAFFLCGALEYLTSFFLEKRFHARWWDYSQKPMNLHGRIWIGNLLLFGLGGVGIIHVGNPLFLRLMALVSPSVRQLLALIFLCVFVADYIVTHFVLKLIKDTVETSEADDTESVNREIRQLLSDRNYFYSRMADAYPEVVYHTDRIKARLEAIRIESERMRREAEQFMSERETQLANALQPVALLSKDVIDQQGQLIDLLYDEETATDEMKELKTAIDQDRERLNARMISKIANRL